MQVSLLILTLIIICNNGINAKPPLKIVGGYNANITDTPSTVMILRWLGSTHQAGLVQCAGSIISNRYILTAAHCLINERDDGKPFPIESFEVIAGENSYNPDAKIYKVEKLYPHPNYIYPSKDSRTDGDIGIIKLKDEIKFGATCGSIELAKRESSSPVTGFSYGWGFTGSETDGFPRSLKEIMLKVHNSADCAMLYPHLEFNYDDLCTSDLLGKGGPCDGDSGGPLIINGTLVGVFSSAQLCDLGYYIDVSYHESWVENIVHDNTEAIASSTTDSSYFVYMMET